MTRTLGACALLASAVAPGTAFAGGLWLNEFGDFAGGRAAAGAAAGVDEAMTMAYNPASIALLEGSQLFASAGAIIGEMDFDVAYSEPRNGTDAGGDAGETAPVSAFAYVHDLDSERWSAGVFFGALSGAGMDYGDDWVGRYQATKVSLLVAALAPTIAYRVDEHLSLGVSAQAVYSDLNLDFDIPRLDPRRPDGEGSIDGDDLQAAFALGAVYEVRPGSRFGLFYQSEIDLKFDGDLKARLPVGEVGSTAELARNVSTDTELTLAEYIRLGIHQDLDERWGVDMTIGWDNWSALGNVFVSTQNGKQGIPTRWRDTWHYAWGVQYNLDKHWDLTGGIAWDGNPVKARDRNAQLPVDRQIRYALGARYKPTSRLSVGGYINYADLGNAKISAARFGGDFDSNSALALVANLSWLF